MLKKNIYDALNCEFDIFCKDEHVYLFDSGKLYEFEKTMFKEIVLSKKSSIVPFWNKEEASDKYNVKCNGLGMYLIKYDQVILNDGSNEYEIRIPTYDIEKFNSLLNLKMVEK